MSRPRLLDLFCGAGGIARGYADAGFEVVGVDIMPQKHYPYEFHQADALQVLDTLLRGECWHGYYYLHDFAAIHASPVCKAYTVLNLSPKELHEKLIGGVRTRLMATSKPYIIENVVGARHDLHASLMLCGSMFDLPIERHRLFETNVFLYPPRPCRHLAPCISVHGHTVWDYSQPGSTRKDGRVRPKSVSVAIGRKAMDIEWMTLHELSQAIPPAYTRWIGTQLLAYLEAAEREVAV